MENFLNQTTRAVIGLYEEGYPDDFEQYGKDQLWGIQDVSQTTTIGSDRIYRAFF